MAGISKNNPDKKNKTQKLNLKLSNECEACIKETGGCEKGKKYVYQISVLYKSGNGIVCPK